MHRALLRSDIVSRILQELRPDWEANEDSYLDLYNCAQTCRFFFQEAIPILWIGCDRHTPGVRHLGLLARQDPKRAQLYANHVTYMYFGFFEDGGKEGCYGPITFDVAYLDVLKSLNFPRLECISIYGTGEKIDDGLLECYAQAELESFTLQGEFDGTLDTFLTTAAERCPKIKTLDFECKGSLTVRIGPFLQTHPNLQRFSLPRMQSAWSLQDFKSVCRMPKLTQLGVPYIEASWLDGVEMGWPVLDQLRTTIPSDAIDQLHELAPALGILELELEGVPSSSDAFASDAFVKLSRFDRLRLIDVTLLPTGVPQEHCINARDIIVLAQSSSQLYKFSVSGEKGHPEIYGINDSFFDDLAKNLPEATEVVFDVDDSSSLTFKAICSLGTHCRKLWQAKVSCSVDWTDDLALTACLPADGAEDLFPTLWELEMVSRWQHKISEPWTSVNLEKLSNFSDRFARAAPELSQVKSSRTETVDEYVSKALKDAIDKRDDAKYMNEGSSISVE